MLLNYTFTLRDKTTNKGYMLGEFRSATLDNALAVCQLKAEAMGLDFSQCEIIDSFSYPLNTNS